jgi:hypothetical protein
MTLISFLFLTAPDAGAFRRFAGVWLCPQKILSVREMASVGLPGSSPPSGKEKTLAAGTPQG